MKTLATSIIALTFFFLLWCFFDKLFQDRSFLESYGGTVNRGYQTAETISPMEHSSANMSAELKSAEITKYKVSDLFSERTAKMWRNAASALTNGTKFLTDYPSNSFEPSNEFTNLFEIRPFDSENLAKDLNLIYDSCLKDELNRVVAVTTSANDEMETFHEIVLAQATQTKSIDWAQKILNVAEKNVGKSLANIILIQAATSQRTGFLGLYKMKIEVTEQNSGKTFKVQHRCLGADNEQLAGGSSSLSDLPERFAHLLSVERVADPAN